jgi:hypothetical protein
VGDEPEIGDAVTVTWRERTDLPPLPVFEKPVTKLVAQKGAG